MQFGTGQMVQNNKRPSLHDEASLDAKLAQIQLDKRLEQLKSRFDRIAHKELGKRTLPKSIELFKEAALEAGLSEHYDAELKALSDRLQ